MATWNTSFKLSPLGTDSPTLGDDTIRETRAAVEERVGNAHYTVNDSESNGTAAQDWWHKMGSAKIWRQATAPAVRINGSSTNLDSNDAGRLWLDSDDDTLSVYTGSAWSEILGAATYVQMTGAQTIAGDKTFSGSSSFTGTITGGSAADIAINTDKFTVTASSGNTAIAGTLTVTGAITGSIAASNVTEISNLTAAEGAQLENIGATTISAGQWGYLGGMDQDVITTSAVTFAQVTVDNLVINANDISSSSGNLTLTPVAGSAVVIDGAASFDAGVVTGITALTATQITGTLQTAAQGNVTSLGTLTGLTLGGDITLTGAAIDVDLKTADQSALIFADGVTTMLEFDTADDEMHFFGGYGSTGVTVDASGNITTDGSITASGISYGNDLDVPGTLTVDTIDDSGAGTTTFSTNVAVNGTFTVDSATTILLDAGGGSVQLEDDGVSFGALTNSSGSLQITAGVGGSLTLSSTSIVTSAALQATGDVEIESGVLRIVETTTPSAVTGYGKIYTKSNNKVYFQDGAGTEHEIAFV